MTSMKLQSGFEADSSKAGASGSAVPDHGTDACTSPCIWFIIVGIIFELLEFQE